MFLMALAEDFSCAVDNLFTRRCNKRHLSNTGNPFWSLNIISRLPLPLFDNLVLLIMLKDITKTIRQINA